MLLTEQDLLYRSWRRMVSQTVGTVQRYGQFIQQFRKGSALSHYTSPNESLEISEV